MSPPIQHHLRNPPPKKKKHTILHTLYPKNSPPLQPPSYPIRPTRRTPSPLSPPRPSCCARAPPRCCCASAASATRRVGPWRCAAPGACWSSSRSHPPPPIVGSGDECSGERAPRVGDVLQKDEEYTVSCAFVVACVFSYRRSHRATYHIPDYSSTHQSVGKLGARKPGRCKSRHVTWHMLQILCVWHRSRIPLDQIFFFTIQQFSSASNPLTWGRKTPTLELGTP